jgi:two-component sensor histidine kinase
LQGYLEELISAVTRSYTIDPDHISVTVKTEPVQVLIDTAIPCGLVVTELISNAFKHAFPDDKKGKISIQLSKDAKENIHLRISDNGVGVPDGFDFRKQPSLGMKTVLMIVEHQLKGTITFDVKRGVKYDIRFADILREVRI